MRKFLNKWVLAVASVLLFTACNKDVDPMAEYPVFSIQVKGSSVEEAIEVKGGEEIELSWAVAKGTAEMGSFKVIVNETILDETQVILEGDDREEYSGNVLYLTPLETVNQQVIFEVIDEEGNKFTKQIVLEVIAEPTVNLYSATLLYAPWEDRNSKTFYSAGLNEKYSYNDVSTTSDPVSGDIDFGYYYFGDTKPNPEYASLAGIADYPEDIYYQNGDQAVSDIEEFWSVKNKTLFVFTDLTVSDFDAITAFDDDMVAQGYEVHKATNPAGKVTGLTIGNVIAFKTKVNDEPNSRFGLLKVTNIVTGDGSDGKIEFDIKVIK